MIAVPEMLSEPIALCSYNLVAWKEQIVLPYLDPITQL